eukprot:scaffold7946_cov267-Pinguiococcus_pyrenoidosus.AAC.3
MVSFRIRGDGRIGIRSLAQIKELLVRACARDVCGAPAKSNLVDDRHRGPLIRLAAPFASRGEFLRLQHPQEHPHEAAMRRPQAKLDHAMRVQLRVIYNVYRPPTRGAFRGAGAAFSAIGEGHDQ